MTGAEKLLDLYRQRVIAAAREWVRCDGIVCRASRVTEEQEAQLEQAEAELRRVVEALGKHERERPS